MLRNLKKIKRKALACKVIKIIFIVIYYICVLVALSFIMLAFLGESDVENILMFFMEKIILFLIGIPIWILGIVSHCWYETFDAKQQYYDSIAEHEIRKIKRILERKSFRPGIRRVDNKFTFRS